MSSLNKVMLIGNLGKEPEIKETNGGKLFAKLSLATNEKYKGESKTTWHSIVVWDEKKAEIIEQYCKKGSKLYIEGKIETRKYEDKEGVERWVYEIVVGSFDGAIRLLDSRPTNGEDADDRPATTRKPAAAKPKRQPGTTRARTPEEALNEAELDDEVPF